MTQRFAARAGFQWIALLWLAAGWPLAAPARDSAAAELRLIDALADLIRASDAATSAVTVPLPGGRTARALRPRPAAPPREREAEPSGLADPLGALALEIHRASPRGPAAFDWADGPADAPGVLWVASEGGGIWRVDPLSGEARLALELPEGFLPNQVRSMRGGGLLLAGPGRAAVLSVRHGGDGAPAPPPRISFAPPGFTLNYALPHATLPVVVGALERLNFARRPEAILLSARAWDPAAGTAGDWTDLPLGSLAWLGSEPRLGLWFAHAKRPGLFDPFPAALLCWNEARGGWAPVSAEGEWADAEPRFSQEGRVVAVWARRLRPKWRAGLPWLQEAAATTATLSNAAFPPVLRERLGASDTATPLSEIPVESLAISPDGAWIAFTRRVEERRSAEGRLRLAIAPARLAAQEARRLDLAGRFREREDRLRAWREAMARAWADAATTETARRPETTDSPPAAASRDGAEWMERLDAAFCAAAPFLRLTPDHTLQSLRELDARLDALGGDLSWEPGAAAALAAYYAGCLRRLAGARHALPDWPPDPLNPEIDLSTSDDFLYTLHSPFSVALRALDERLSLAGAAEELLARWPRPVYLTDRFAPETLLWIQENLDEPPPDAPLAMGDWALVAAIGGGAEEEEAAAAGRKGRGGAARWPLALELARRHPASAQGFSLLGHTLGAEGLPGPALAAHLRAAQMEPASLDLQLTLGQAALDFSRFDIAIRAFRDARRLDRDGLWSEMIDEALRALRADPSALSPNSPPPAP